MTTTSPAWADVAWNPIHGCAVAISDRGAETDLRPYEPIRAPYLRRLRTKQPPPDVMGGDPLSSRTRFKSGWLRAPMGWKVPLRICVCAPVDLFAGNAPDDKIDAVFAVTAMAPWHTFLIATKHPLRMYAYLRKQDAIGDIRPFQIEKAARKINGYLPDGTFTDFRSMPFPNVELGVFAAAHGADDPYLLKGIAEVSAAHPFVVPPACDGEPVWMRPYRRIDGACLSLRS